jgi:hypothetical protein
VKFLCVGDGIGEVVVGRLTVGERTCIGMVRRSRLISVLFCITCSIIVSGSCTGMHGGGAGVCRGQDTSVVVQKGGSELFGSGRAGAIRVLEVGVFVTLKLLYKIFSIKSKVIWHGYV